jgi:hypothetical protein
MYIKVISGIVFFLGLFALYKEGLFQLNILLLGIGVLLLVASVDSIILLGRLAGKHEADDVVARIRAYFSIILFVLYSLLLLVFWNSFGGGTS